MNDHPAKAAGGIRHSNTTRVLLEGLIVAATGLVFAIAANWVSPRGLALMRDYFPGAPPSPVVAEKSAAQQPANSGAVASAASGQELVVARLRSHGLALADSNQVVTLFHDPRYKQERVVFIDARADREYQAGHVPGAYQFDNYHFEQYIPTVLPICETAQQIVVYCNGGDCEDSVFAAITLRDAGIPNPNLLVYAGGIAEWAASGLPLERGPRGSGDLSPRKP